MTLAKVKEQDGMTLASKISEGYRLTTGQDKISGEVQFQLREMSSSENLSSPRTVAKLHLDAITSWATASGAKQTFYI